MTAARWAAALLVTAAAAAWAAVLLPVGAVTSDRPEACVALADLREAFDLSALSNQVVIRQRVAALADALADPDGQVPDELEEVGRNLLDLLDRPSATVADLQEQIAPVVVACGAGG